MTEININLSNVNNNVMAMAVNNDVIIIICNKNILMNNNINIANT